MSSIDKVLLDSDSNDEFIRQLMTSVVMATKEANSIPQGSDFQFHEMSAGFQKSSSNAKAKANDLLELICNLVKPGSALAMTEDLSDAAMYEQVVDVIDSLLENADRFLDSNRKKASLISNNVNQSLLLDKGRVVSKASSSLPKPQVAFYSEIDNERMNPFRPRLATKYHYNVPLDLSPKRLVADDEEDENAASVGPDEYYPHPYEHELRALQYPKWCTTDKDLKKVGDKPTYSSEPFTLVESDEAFDLMLTHLLGKSELAIDLEHHSMYTFQGLTCLMQISTREQDFIVDALALRRRMVELGQVLADPAVVKVLHGCDKDILWMQRDFGLYVVNCFDTHVAAKALNYPALSLAHLLKMHCGVTADKKHQLSDWRVRELPAEMLHYAKEDTHYLLYIYDRMRLELWKKLGQAGLEQVFNTSKQLCLARYEKPRFYPLGYRDLFRETGVSRAIPKLSELSSLQEAALAAVWDWRDQCARAEDDSCAVLMSNAELLRVGVHIPQTPVQLEQKCGPLSAFTRKNTAEILRIVANSTSVGPASFSSAMASGTAETSGSSHSFASPSSKAANSAAAAVAAVKASKAVLHDSVYTFTPAILSPVITSGRSAGTLDQLTSPILRTEEVFKQAGWNTPQYKDSASYSPLLLDATKLQQGVSEENRQRAQRSREELASAHTEEFNNYLSKLAASPSEDQLRSQHTKATRSRSPPSRLTSLPESADCADSSGVPSHTVDVGGVPMEIPKSFEEVYQLSQRNRQRNKDKRRGGGLGAGLGDADGEEEDGEGGDGGGDGMDVDEAGCEERDTSFTLRSGLDNFESTQYSGGRIGSGKADAAKVDADFYLSQSQQGPPEIDVDSTLEFAQSLGWVKGATNANSLREAHYQDLSFQQQQQQSQGADSSSGFADDASSSARSDQNTMRKSNDKSAKNSGNRTSGEGIAADHSKKNTSKAAVNKAFDYSKVPHAAIGALPTNSNAPNKAKEEHNGKGSKSKGGKGRGGPVEGASGVAPMNPYLFGGNVGSKNN